MTNPQRARHGEVIPQPIRSSLLQPRSCAGFHHQSHILHQLAHAWSYFSSSNSNDHAFWGTRSLVCGQCFSSRAIVGAHMGPLLCSSSCHCRDVVLCCKCQNWRGLILGGPKYFYYFDRTTCRSAQPKPCNTSDLWPFKCCPEPKSNISICQNCKYSTFD